MEGLPEVGSVYDAFETDETLERDGVVCDLGPGVGKWKLAHVGEHKKFQSDLADRMKPFSHAQSRGLLDPKIVTDLLIDLFAKHIIIGFEGVVGRDNKPVEYSEEAAREILRDLPQLFKILRDFAGNFANYRSIYAEEVAGK